MAVPGLTPAVYLFAIMSMATGVIILVHFFSAKTEISFAVVYIWETAVFIFALLSMIRFTLIRKDTNHAKEIRLQKETKLETHRSPNTTKMKMLQVRFDLTHRTGSKIARDAVLILCGTGSGILPLYEAWQDFPCMSSKTDLTFYISKFISLVLSGLFSILEIAFVLCLRKYRCISGHARVLVAIILSANVCMLTNFILNVIRASNTNTKQLSMGVIDADFTKVLVFSYCKNETEHLDNATTVAGQLYKYTNTFVLEFGLFAFGILVPVWNIMALSSGRNINRDDSIEDVSNVEDRSDNYTDRRNLITQNDTHYAPSSSFRIVQTLEKVLIFVSRHSLKFSLLFALPVLGFHIFSEVHNMVNEGSDVVLETAGKNESLSRFEKGNYYLQTGNNYIISTIPFIGYLIAKGDEMSSWRLTSDNILLVSSGCSRLLLVLFETADSIAGFLSSTDQHHLTQEIVYFVKVIFNYIGIYFQIMFITKAYAIAKDTNREQTNRRLFIKGIIIFLAVCNTERWLVDSFLPPTNLSYVNDVQNEDTLGIKNWWYITEFLFPVVTFYRLLSALLCFEVRDRFQETGY